MTFNELYPHWIANKRLDVKAGTVANYQMVWTLIQEKLGPQDVSSFGRIEARMLLSEFLDSGLSPKTSRDRMAMIKQMVSFGALELEIPIKPLKWGLKYPTTEGRELKHFTEAETLRIVTRGMEEIENGEYSVVPILIALLTGMRIGEVAGLRWADIDNVHNIITVRRNVIKIYSPEEHKERLSVGSPKTKNAYRDIPMLSILKKCLRIYGGPKPNPEYYVIGNREVPMGPNPIRSRMERFMDRHRLPKVNFHGLRHTYATMLVTAGGDLKTVSTLLGHSDVALTMNLYVHPSIESKRAAVNKAFRKVRDLFTKTETTTTK